MIETRTRPARSFRSRRSAGPGTGSAYPQPSASIIVLLFGIAILLAGLIWVMKLESTLPSIRVGESTVSSTSGPVALKPGTYVAEDPSITRTGNWFVQTLGSTAPPSTTSSEVTSTAGSGMSFLFYGTDLSMTARIGPESGKVYVQVDGQQSSVLPADEQGTYVDFYANQAEDASILLAHGLAHRDHTVQIISDGSAEVAISAFEVSANTPFPWAFVLLYVALTACLFVSIRAAVLNACHRLGWI